MIKNEIKKVCIYLHPEDFDTIDGFEKILDDILVEVDGETEVVLRDADYYRLERLRYKIGDIVSGVHVDNN
jgi:hypothetical protein